MGKGTIVNHIADGQYNVTVNYNRVDLTAAIAVLEARETLLIDAIAAETDDLKKELLRLQLVSVQKRIEYLEDTDHVPADDTITAWCADLTTDLTGGVGLIEIGREQANGVNIQPGFEGNAVFDADRDGQLTPLMAQDPAATFYNLAMLPGTQKWKPTYLYGEITTIDYDLDTCSVTLDAVTSSQQGLNINQAYAIDGVPIDYMTCNSRAFEVGDRVLVQFEGYSWDAPKVIGFESEPKPCDCFWEPWDGPLINTLFPWSIYRIAPEGVPDEMKWASVIVEGSLIMHLPAQTIEGRHIEFVQLITPAPDGWVKESATRAQVICSSLLATCSWDDGNSLTVPSPSALAVFFNCTIISTGIQKYFWIFFFADDHLDGTPAAGHWCSEYFGPNYLYEYTPIHRTYYSGDFVYLPYGVDNAVWVDFPEPVKVNSVYAYGHAHYGLVEGDPMETYDLPAPEMMFKIDSIEIC